ncbi:type II toxin-antitoxin system RelE/ParE family toxin [Flavobacterium zepuense]|uniref:Type II toxin-antitoxin system RelE/ParE family toxin n=1 Tax=Flavobacterium zepuense TaxID=2593302 RepID=A0A552UW27_9FLAO|nr:type II toxin-antitoxin system RelE/ParE family toxin [Flavobacterium zepuense]
MKIIWRKKASDELEAIYNFIKQESPQNALLVFNKIFDLANSLIVIPEKYPIEPSVNNPSVRFAVIWNYKIIYAIHKNSVVILRIFSTRQNPKKSNP